MGGEMLINKNTLHKNLTPESFCKRLLNLRVKWNITKLLNVKNRKHVYLCDKENDFILSSQEYEIGWVSLMSLLIENKKMQMQWWFSYQSAMHDLWFRV